MKIRINNQEKLIDESQTLGDLMTELQMKKPGIAVAVNQRVINRMEWDSLVLKENDDVIIIKAACGG